MALLIASDLHVAEIWDRIEQVLPPETRFLNPNRNFRELVSRVRKGETLILNGDLVDCQEAAYEGGGRTNWEFFRSILDGCAGKTLLNLGNHDYRRLPYNFSIYGLHHVNIPGRVRRRYRDGIGFFRFRWFKEIRSIKAGKRAPSWYENPRYRSVMTKERELLFLETGPDALNMAKNWLMPWHWPVMFKEIASRGLDEEQLRFLADRLQKGTNDLFLFLHAPPFFTIHGIQTMRIGNGEHLEGYRLRGRTFFDGNNEFIRLLMETKRNVTVISGHTHVPRQFLIDKEEKTLSESDLDGMNRLRGEERYLKFFTTMPLGAIRKPNREVGYLRLDKKGFSFVIIDEYA